MSLVIAIVDAIVIAVAVVSALAIAIVRVSACATVIVVGITLIMHVTIWFCYS